MKSRIAEHVSGKLRQLGYVAIVLLLAAAAFPPSASGADDAKKKEKGRADIQKMERETLAGLYKAQPKAKDAVAKAAGYAVFSNFGMKIFFAGGGSGKGVALNNATARMMHRRRPPY